MPSPPASPISSPAQAPPAAARQTGPLAAAIAPPRPTRRKGLPLWRSLTPSGRAVVLAMLLCALQMDPTWNWIFLLFMSGGALLAVSAGVAWWGRPHLLVQRIAPERVTAGEPFRYRLLLENPSRRAARDLLVSEETALVTEAGALAYLPLLAAGARRRIDMELVAARRGNHLLPGPAVQSVFPFGLLKWGRRLDQPAKVLAYPRPTTVARIHIPLGARYQPGGIPLASAVGEWGDFVGTRLFREGDSLRRIHWRSWARVGYPVVKEYQEEYFSRVALILDTLVPARATPEHRAAFEAAVSLSAGLAEHFSRQELIVDLLAVGPHVYHVSAGRSVGVLDHVMEILACVEPGPRHALDELEAHMAEFVDQVGAAVVVLLDLDDRRISFLRSLAGHGLALKAIVVSEAAPSFPGDLEGLVHLPPSALAHPVESL